MPNKKIGVKTWIFLLEKIVDKGKNAAVKAVGKCAPLYFEAEKKMQLARNIPLNPPKTFPLGKSRGNKTRHLGLFRAAVLFPLTPAATTTILSYLCLGCMCARVSMRTIWKNRNSNFWNSWGVSSISKCKKKPGKCNCHNLWQETSLWEICKTSQILNVRINTIDRAAGGMLKLNFIFVLECPGNRKRVILVSNAMKLGMKIHR